MKTDENCNSCQRLRSDACFIRIDLFLSVFIGLTLRLT